MGTYTELVLSFELKKDTPKIIINTLKYMIKNGDNYHLDNLDMWFLNDDNRCKWMLRSSSYYFAYPASLSDIDYNEITKTHSVSIRCSFKNYYNEIDLFLKWITPHINPYGHNFLGYSLYEEANEPKLIYLSDYL